MIHVLKVLLKLWGWLFLIATAQRIVQVAYLRITWKWRGREGWAGIIRDWLAHMALLWLHVRFKVYSVLWYFGGTLAWQRGQQWGFHLGIKTPLGAVAFVYRFMDSSRILKTGLQLHLLPPSWRIWELTEGAQGYTVSKDWYWQHIPQEAADVAAAGMVH